MLVSEPQSYTVCTPTQCPPPCMCLFVPKGTPTHATSLWLPLGECVSRCVCICFLCVSGCLCVSFQGSMWLWGRGGLWIFLQAFLGSGFQGLLCGTCH